MSTEIGTLLVSSPDVCGGRLRIDGTRITVIQIVVLHKRGYTPEEIAEEYHSLTMAQVYTALAHYHANQDEIESDLAAEKEEAQEQADAATGSPKRNSRLEAFKELQLGLGLTPDKAADWQAALRDARR
jgi:uncharacterized protein (DUF433 family)